MLARASYGPPEKAYGNEVVEHPGYAVLTHGKGRTAMVPWTIGRSYRDLGLTVARDVLHAIVQELRNHVGKEIGPIAKPKTILVVPELPKTRSGKIMRRLLKDVAEGREVGDATTLADNTVMAQIAQSLRK